MIRCILKIDPTALAGGLNVGYERKSRKKWTPKPWAWNHHQMTGQKTVGRRNWKRRPEFHVRDVKFEIFFSHSNGSFQ